MPIICREIHLIETDSRSGARVFRLTSFPCVSNNFYGEVPYMDADSRYVMFGRQYAPGRPLELWRAGLLSSQLQMVDENCPGLAGAAVSPDQSAFYYCRVSGHGTFLVNLDMASLKRSEMELEFPGIPKGLGSVTPDKKTYVMTPKTDNTPAVVRVELDSGKCSVIYENPHIPNPHLQVDPGDGRRVLVQINETDGAKPKELSVFSRTRSIGLGLLDMDSGKMERLAVGPPYTEVNCQGHQCFIGTTGRVLLTLSERGGDPSPDEITARRQKNIEQGNLVSIGPGENSHTVVAHGHRFTHPNASRDGRFFVSDTSEGLLVVGSINTGKCRILCDTGTSFCTAQFTHPQPYLSPDCRWVIFNSDATGTPQLYAAEIPGGFLEGLE